MELSEEEKKAIEWLEKAEYFSARLYAPIILNLINNYKKEIDREKQYSDLYEDLCNTQQKVIIELQKDKKVLIKNYDKVLGNFISKDKIRDYFAQALAFKRRLIREKEEISDYNRGKFDTIEDLLERLEDNRWN